MDSEEIKVGDKFVWKGLGAGGKTFCHEVTIVEKSETSCGPARLINEQNAGGPARFCKVVVELESGKKERISSRELFPLDCVRY